MRFLTYHREEPARFSCDTTKHDCMKGFVCMRNLLIALIAAASNGTLCRFEGVLTCLIFRRTYDQLIILGFPLPYAIQSLIATSVSN